MNHNAYCIIPTYIMHDKNLRDKAKLLYGEIVSLSNEKGYCYASNRYFANLYDCSITTISTLINELLKNNYIQISYEYRKGTKEILKRYIKIFKGGIKENLKDNNINNNNIKRKKEKYKKKEYTSVTEVLMDWLNENNNIEVTNIFEEEMENLYNDFR